MKINFQDRYEVNGRSVSGNFQLTRGKLSLLSGENGAGKSTFIQFLKLNRKEFFGNSSLSFIDQRPLMPLNGVSLSETLAHLDPYRNKECELWKEYLFLIKEFENKEIRYLSGGQNQIAKVFLGLYLGSDIFILDEPTQFLDSKNIENLKKVLVSLKNGGKKVLLVEHRKEIIADFVDEDLFIIRGKNDTYYIQNKEIEEVR